MFIDVHTHNTHHPDEVLPIINRYPDSYLLPNTAFSIGIHPWYILEEKLYNELSILEEKLQHPNCYALGECGLDKLSQTDFQLQLDVFKEQIKLSEKFQKPLLIHCVKSFQEIVLLKKKTQPKQPWIIHGFNKHFQVAKELTKHGISLSFGAALLQNKKLQETAKKVSLTTLFLETDNSKESIISIYKKLSEIKEIELNLVKQEINKNYKHIFTT
ncbi:TatD family hydrolase [Tenacibaculum maritimum]|uniref:TatD family hydrolase n=1 Tax=Tenacibaculum maritimum TaxID=107401 RepID=UPI0012E472C4|nr:TatD family hydrolase [Tenacibaculum maritimum]CAA0147682.1 TatD DNase family protein [Tenacibaculum maritimum]CAA0151221.1 TatD DNase family protein [Tenacibaculum maritimum]